ncbi:hypothetical protein LDL08_02400 [Nonomuraea glycinis]|uniref:DUF7660 domain-containing protein n=1 Tax=Nonomuraea glycinis TaxID=2047744 RepID=A0A917ZZY3_9ACTN|nr:hypothetical protein [Nonomuraea glycinis]MCA2175027.1 hypothetical protein [Nonomuraea glycinis]GGP01065.1 hypothetical protein GCM10012278_03340 [Nonomuraea glycinis]
MDLVTDTERIVTREDLANFVAALAAAADSPEVDEWENNNLPRFLDGLSGWLYGMRGYFVNQGLNEPEQPSWKLVGEMLAAATLYE